MHIATILPHTLLYGGVKRFLELGNIFISLGHKFTIYTPAGQAPNWYDFNGDVKDFTRLQEDKIDALFFTEPEFLEITLKSSATLKVFYFINPKESLKVFKKHPAIKVFANSKNLMEIALKKYGVQAFPAFGGINLKSHFPKPYSRKEPSSPFVVMAYGRLARGVKGTKYVVEACKKLIRRGYDIKLLLFDTPVTEKMFVKNSKFKTSVPLEFIQNHPVERNYELYHKAHVFVAAESKAGWSNTAAEALACGTPVIGTTAGTTNFLIHNQTGFVVSRNSRKIAYAIEQLINDEELRRELAENGRKKIEEFDWKKLAQQLLNYIQETLD